MKGLRLSVRFPNVVFCSLLQIYSELGLTSTGGWHFSLAADLLIIFTVLSRTRNTVLLHRKDMPSSILTVNMLDQLLNYEELFWKTNKLTNKKHLFDCLFVLNRGHFLFNQAIYQKKFASMVGWAYLFVFLWEFCLFVCFCLCFS